MKANKKEILVSTYLNYINVLLKCYTERYQDIPLKVFFKMELDTFWEEITGMVHPDLPNKESFKNLKDHLIEFQEDRNSLNQKHIPYPLKYIYIKEFYWSISGFLLGEEFSVSKRLLFTELLYMRHQIFSLDSVTRDLTQNNGTTHYALAVHGYYEKYGNNFGMNDNFFRPEDMYEIVNKVIDPLLADGHLTIKIKEIDKKVEESFGLYERVQLTTSNSGIFRPRY